jgi:DNA repair protein RadD
MLRPYQQASADAALDWVRRSVEPCLLDLATGAGKSHIIAEIAGALHKISKGKHVLCLAPSAELVTQNREKYLATGNPASVYSASAGAKCLRWPVVFGTPGTVKGVAKRLGSRFCAVILDEAHGITPTVRKIIDDMRESNPNLRVIGLSATPYRLGSGYIYRIDERDRALSESEARNPYFAKLLYRVPPALLIEQGYLTKPVISATGAESYDTSGLELNRRGQFNAGDIDRAFVGHGRKTAAIVADVVARCQDRRGVMLFAATVKHAHEVLASLPPALSAIVTGETTKQERERIITRFKRQEIKYIVNVSVLTTGFDAPHVDAIALLRATESVGLMQQIIGRGLRISEGKTDCIIMDYAGNIDRHCPDGDLFDPEVRAKGSIKDGEPVEVICPDCNSVNLVSLRPNPDGFGMDKNGYFVDLRGQRIMTNDGPMPAHFGRRCMAELPAPGGRLLRCEYRWTCKKCHACDADNDIAARYCSECGEELVDPNEKLIADFKALKRDPRRLQTDRVVDWEVKPTVSQKGNECLRVTYVTEYRQFTTWYMPKAAHGRPRIKYDCFYAATHGATKMPDTVTYKKEENGLFEVYAYGRPADEVSAVA